MWPWQHENTFIKAFRSVPACVNATLNETLNVFLSQIKQTILLLELDSWNLLLNTKKNLDEFA